MSSNTVAPRSDETRPPDAQQTLTLRAEFHGMPNLFPDGWPNGSNESSSASTVVPDGGGLHQDSRCSPEDLDVTQKGSPFFGVRHFCQRSSGVIDPFDYEQKYGEDKPYEEMGESGRMWKTYLSESAKVDADKVMSWTDALDVLLVFAGLFSAVVSTFVSQTFQTLQIDNGEVTAYLVFELVHLQRAAMDGLTSDAVPHSHLTPDMTFRATSTATWVNGLWFTSLALSLTTALIAVLTKQWIHEYRTSIQLGTYRERGRIRQFRFTNMSEWHVPVIIGLLPILMHVALGVFFAGLILLLLSLSKRITASISVIVAAALAAYLVTNILPIFDPGCPYKTPLTHYAYRLSCHIRQMSTWFSLRRIVVLLVKRHRDSGESSSTTGTSTERWKAPICLCEERLDQGSQSDSAPDVSYASIALCSSTPSTLGDAEKAIVQSKSYIIDAEASVWLYGVSSNSSVQTIVLQAIANLPLESIPLVMKTVPRRALEGAIETVMGSPEYKTLPAAQPLYELLTRSLIRISPDRLLPWVPAHMKSTFSLPRLLDPSERSFAASFLSEQILAPSAKYDVAVWVQILGNAMRSGPAWLGKEQNSPVWRKFIYWLLFQTHSCISCSKRLGSHGYVYETRIHNFNIHEHGANYGDSCLTVLDNPSPGFGTAEAITLQEAITRFLVPSLSDFILRILYPISCRAAVYHTIPSDIRLHHALLQLPEYQKTGRPNNPMSPIACIVDHIGDTVGINVGLYSSLHPYHPDIPSATFHTLTAVVSSTFGNDVLLSGEKQRLLHALFRALLLDSELAVKYHAWMNDAVSESIIRAIFPDSCDLPSLAPLLYDVVKSTMDLQCPRLLPQIYRRLCQGHWLEVIGAARFGPRRYAPVHREETAYSFLAAAFIEGLDILRSLSLPIYGQVWSYIQRPSNLLMLCKLLILSDVERCGELKKLAPMIDRRVWEPCLEELAAFIESRAAHDRYEHHRTRSLHPYLNNTPLIYKPYGQLARAVTDLAAYTRRHSAPVPRTIRSGIEILSWLGVMIPGTSSAVEEKDEMA